MLPNSCRFLKFDQIFEMKTGIETTQAIILETHKKPVIGTKTLPERAKFLHKSIKDCEIYKSRMQVKSKPFHIP